jgi:hypothetical protein
MPDQPADPLHYEMKIPPEPQRPNTPPDSPQSDSADGTSQADHVKETDIERDENNPQSDRRNNDPVE